MLLIDRNLQVRQKDVCYSRLLLRFMYAKQAKDIALLSQLEQDAYRDAGLLKENNIFEALRFSRLAQEAKYQIFQLNRRKLFKLIKNNT